MKTPEKISKDIRDDYFHRYEIGDYINQPLNDNLDTLIVGAVSPLCQRIDALQDALHDFLMELDDESEWIFTGALKARLRSILGGREGGS